jgi:hypothetical protein
MARIALYKDNYADSTVVSNLFIDEYMKDANDAQLKVYFYLLRMLNADQAISVSGIAVQPHGKGCDPCIEILGEAADSGSGL